MSRLAHLVRRVGVYAGVIPDPNDPEAGTVTRGDLARLALALALVVGIFLYVALCPLSAATPGWAIPVAWGLGSVIALALAFVPDARRRR